MAKEFFIKILSLASLLAKYGEIKEYVAPESNKTLALTLSIKSVPTTAVLEAWTSCGLMVKTLPCPLSTGPCGCDRPVFCIGAFPLSIDPQPLVPSIRTAAGVIDGIEYWAALCGHSLLKCPNCPHL